MWTYALSEIHPTLSKLLSDWIFNVFANFLRFTAANMSLLSLFIVWMLHTIIVYTRLLECFSWRFNAQCFVNSTPSGLKEEKEYFAKISDYRWFPKEWSTAHEKQRRHDNDTLQNLRLKGNYKKGTQMIVLFADLQLVIQHCSGNWTLW